MRGQIVAAVLVWLLALDAGAAGPALRTYVDQENGISFSYPAHWLLNGDDDAATAKFRITSEGQPIAVVQLEGNFADQGPYKDTDFEAGAFAYTVLPLSAQEPCLARLDAIAGDEHRPVDAVWNGLRARRLEAARYAVAGTIDTHEIVATYERGRCYLFETVLVSKEVGGPIKPLAPFRWKGVCAEFEAVMRSVRMTHTSHGRS